ncbi:MAG: DUF3788 family protein [Gemmatimonadales bacterium]|nr:DUF3788 family protein [Gemmatimonadales bacterium]NIN12633.1 DUF3788 family protein [Gemmatimonadales bacterium]NIR02426.1 DUF3788 family protein [Gemmatimonadales bacterium]NIS66217.1 DUF3788 family protein [Gemmatimonadales bacterium]
MATSAFDDKSAPPQAGELAAALGGASPLWDSLVAALASQHAPLSETWKFGGQKWGWTLQLKQRKRTVLYLTPCRGHFVAGFAIGEKAVRAAHQTDLPAAVLGAIDSARKYAEGRAVRLEVRRKRDLAAVEKLAAVKMAN